jgi:hypothetical protein
MVDPQPCPRALIYSNHLHPYFDERALLWPNGQLINFQPNNDCSRHPVSLFRTIRWNAQTIWGIRFYRPLGSRGSSGDCPPIFCTDRIACVDLSLADDSSLTINGRTTGTCMPKRQLTRATRGFQSYHSDRRTNMCTLGVTDPHT